MKCDRQLFCWLVIKECEGEGGTSKRETGAEVDGIMVWGGNVSVLERTGLT